MLNGSMQIKLEAGIMIGISLNEGIIRQVNRMKKIADTSRCKFVVADFVCPLHQQIKVFKPQIICLDGYNKKSRYKSMISYI